MATGAQVTGKVRVDRIWTDYLKDLACTIEVKFMINHVNDGTPLDRFG